MIVLLFSVFPSESGGAMTFLFGIVMAVGKLSGAVLFGIFIWGSIIVSAHSPFVPFVVGCHFTVLVWISNKYFFKDFVVSPLKPRSPCLKLLLY